MTGPTYCIYNVFVKKIVFGKGVLEILEKKAGSPIKAVVTHQRGILSINYFLSYLIDPPLKFAIRFKLTRDLVEINGVADVDPLDRLAQV